MERFWLYNKLKWLYTKELAISIFGTIFGGIALTGLLFFFGEVVLPAPNLTGEWRIAAKTTKTTYSPFLNVTAYSKVEILQKGCEIIGSGDITSEKNPNGDSLTFKPEKRVKIDVMGYLEHHYITPSSVCINIIEYGERAKSTNTFKLKVKDENHLTGTFYSTISNSRGQVVFERQ